MNSSDTIVAISSAVGSAARMIVRLSGARAREIARRFSDGTSVGASRERVRVRGVEFPAWLYIFRAPRSYTGEDLVEFHIPGNVLLARWLVEDLISAGARAAEPGEFTARAYFNSRIDLTEAEGIAATIAAQNEQELAAARQLMSGELARRLKSPMESLAQTLALVEVGIDFSDEEVSFLSREELRGRLTQVNASLGELVTQSARFERLSHEPEVVLVGRPNAGKSTLLNALAGFDRAVVSPVAGTTRDAISAQVKLRRGFVHVTDVAGLEETSPTGEIERQMHARAVETLERADIVVLVIDATDRRAALSLPRQPHLVVVNKSDLIAPFLGNPGDGGGEGSAGNEEGAMRNAELDSIPHSAFRVPHSPQQNPHPSVLPDYRERGQGLGVSAATGENLSLLRDRLDELAFGRPSGFGVALNARHLRAIDDAQAALSRASEHIGVADELIAFELRQALDALGQILGVVSPDELLGRIFSTFCIGK